MLSWPRILLGWCVVVLIVSVLAWGATFSPSCQKCAGENDNKEGRTEQPKLDEPVARGASIGIFLLCEGKFIDENNVTLTALATAAIAGFTLTLWLATTWLWSAGERQHAISNRAFVLIDGFNFEITTAADGKSEDIMQIPERYKTDPGLYVTRFAVQPRWKNSGNTPTKKMSIQVNWIGPPSIIIPPDDTYKDHPQSFFIGPNAVEAGHFFETPSAQVLIDYEMHYGGARPMIFIWGRADYHDVFNSRHFVEWCYQLRFERHTGEKVRASLIQWGDYNRSDEDARA